MTSAFASWPPVAAGWKPPPASGFASTCARTSRSKTGIHAARMLLPRCWFDAERCRAGLESLQHYRRDYNSRLNELKATPVHDWSSHGADAFRGLAIRHRPPREPKKPVDCFLRQQDPHEFGWMA